MVHIHIVFQKFYNKKNYGCTATTQNFMGPTDRAVQSATHTPVQYNSVQR